MKELIYSIIASCMFLGCVTNEAKIADNKSPEEIEVIFKIAIKTYNRQEYKKAFLLLEPLAKEGHKDAAFILARMYNFAEGLEQNDDKSFDWYLFAAERNHAQSQAIVANRFYTGTGINKNYYKFMKWKYICSNNKTATQKIKDKCSSDFQLYFTFRIDNKQANVKNLEIEKIFKKWKRLSSL